MTTNGFFQAARDQARRTYIPDRLREEYASFLLRRQERITIPAMIVGTAIMVGLLAIDFAIIPDVFWLGLSARLLIALPAAMVAYAYLRVGSRSLRAHYVVGSSLALLYGTLACVILVSSASPWAPMYLTSNNVTIMFVILILGFPPRLAVSMAAILIAIQAAILGLSDGASMELLLLTTGISLSIALPSIYGNLRIDNDQRQQFLAKRRDREQLRTLTAQNALLERLSVLDPLTGLSNRRGFNAMLKAAIEEAQADPTIPAIALAMIDVDHFKLYNDAYGHPAGDEALQQVGLALSSITADTETVARFGGEEFVVVLPLVEPLALELTGARLRTSVERAGILHPSSPTARTVTVSIGIAYAQRDDLDRLSSKDLIQTADQALYRAKAGGRNRVMITAWRGSSNPSPEALQLRAR